jgi:hypothetical protein
MSNQSRTKIKWIWIVFLAASIVAGIVSLNARQADPVYNGIPLRVILNENLWFRFKPDGTNFSVYTPRERDYFRALHGIGELAWPVLVAHYQMKDGKIKTWIATSWVKRIPWINRLIPDRWAYEFVTRRAVAFCAISELLHVSGERGPTEDPTWGGIQEFPLSFRQRAATDMGTILRQHLKAFQFQNQYGDDEGNRIAEICDFLGRIGTNGEAALPEIHEVAQAGFRVAEYALARLEQKTEFPVQTSKSSRHVPDIDTSRNARP